jgi:hypothetical protein
MRSEYHTKSEGEDDADGFLDYSDLGELDDPCRADGPQTLEASRMAELEGK